MNTIKTAISIDVKTFKRVDRLARRLHISRSQFFTQAARHMVEKDHNLDLIRRINAAYEHDADETARREQEKVYSSRRGHGSW